MYTGQRIQYLHVSIRSLYNSFHNTHTIPHTFNVSAQDHCAAPSIRRRYSLVYVASHRHHYTPRRPSAAVAPAGSPSKYFHNIFRKN